jgi:hypothetical protein
MRSAEPAKSDYRFFALLLIAGIALRLMWLGFVRGPIDAQFASAEASRVALAIADGRGIADAFYKGYGPTAHLMPVSPAIAGFIFWCFGSATKAANLALLAWCLAQVAAAYCLLYRLFRTIGADPPVTRWGLALLCLIVPFAPQETIDFRYWEGATALCLATASLILIVRYDRKGEPSFGAIVFATILFAVTFFISPPAGLATGVCWAVLAIRRFSFRRCFQLASFAGIALLLIITPWALRNERVLGTPVLLRSDFGLELALANHPGALSNKPPALVFHERLAQIHPFERHANPPFLVKPGGEVAYSRKLEQQTLGWIAANPRGFATLSVRHVSEFFFPRPWQMFFSGWAGMGVERAIAISTVNLLGLIGLALGLYRRRRGYWILATYAGVLGLQYAFFQPTARYTYLIYGMMAFLAVQLVIESAAAFVRQLRPKTSGPPSPEAA